MSTKRKRAMAVVGLTVAATLIGWGAAAYWTGGGAGTGSVKDAASVSDVTISQTASTGNLAPGTSVPLAGSLTNPNTTDVKVGTLTATITGVDGGAAVADFAITGNGVLVNAVVKKGTPLAWNGMTLAYANSAVNQDSGKNATVSISYSVSAFVEPPATGTFSYPASKILTVSNVASWPTATGDMTVQAGDQLYVHVPAGGLDSASDQLIVAAVNGQFNFISNGGFYILHNPGSLELKRGTTYYLRTPAWIIN